MRIGCRESGARASDMLESERVAFYDARHLHLPFRGHKMKNLLVFLASVLFATTLTTAVLRADEKPKSDSPEGAARIEALIQEAKKLKEANKDEEAIELMKKARALALERDANARARNVARDSQEREQGEKEAQIRKLLEASELLQVVGKQDLAEQLRREAMALKANRETPQRERAREGDRPREGERTRDEANRNREGQRAREAGPREGDPREQIQDLQAGMRRMHAEMEELRQMVRRLAERLGDR